LATPTRIRRRIKNEWMTSVAKNEWTSGSRRRTAVLVVVLVDVDNHHNLVMKGDDDVDSNSKIPSYCYQSDLGNSSPHDLKWIERERGERLMKKLRHLGHEALSRSPISERRLNNTRLRSLVGIDGAQLGFVIHCCWRV